VKPKPTIDRPHSGHGRRMDSRASRRTRGAELEPTMSKGRDAATGVVEKERSSHSAKVTMQHNAHTY